MMAVKEGLTINPEKKFAEMVAGGKTATEAMAAGDEVVFVGWQLHYLIRGKDGDVLSSVGGYAEGFEMEDYE